MKKYFKWALYHFAGMFESFIKFVLSLFMYYPQLNISEYVLYMFESKRIDSDRYSSLKKRESQMEMFKTMRSEAYCDEV